MQNTNTTLQAMYAAFNARDIETCLACMSDHISWPTASEGGRVTGKAEIRAYWTRQWTEFDPRVDPLEIIGQPDGRTEVRVHQVVKSLNGTLLSDQEVRHIYLIHDGLIHRMDILAETSGFH